MLPMETKSWMKTFLQKKTKISDFLKIFSLTHCIGQSTGSDLLALSMAKNVTQYYPRLDVSFSSKNDVNLWRKLSKKKKKKMSNKYGKLRFCFFSQPHQCIHHKYFFLIFFENGFQKHWIWKGWIIMVAIILFDIRCANVIMSFEMFEWWCVTNVYISIGDLKKWKKMKWKGCDKRREK